MKPEGPQRYAQPGLRSAGVPRAWDSDGAEAARTGAPLARSYQPPESTKPYELEPTLGVTRSAAVERSTSDGADR